MLKDGLVKNIFYAQSGGPTAVINASACGLIETARANSDTLGTVYVGKNGILGALNEELIDTSLESAEDIHALMHTPASAFGTCRFKLKSIEEDESQYKRLIEVFKAHDIGYFFYNGGGDSQDTAYKVSQMGERLGYPLTCIGVPKTIDNDLMHTDCCPGFGSVAKYVAISTQEAALDVKGMAATSTKVFILEVMGRHTGWIAASAALGAKTKTDAPHIILLPEVTFDQAAFLKKTKETVEREGFCVIVASEGIHHADGAFLADSGLKDAFGHSQLGGVAPVLSNMIQNELGFKNHWAVSDYLQRAARHIASQTDVDQAYAMGKSAIEAAIAGENNVMITIERTQESPYQWQPGTTPLSTVANDEKTVPDHFISDDNMYVTAACCDYIRPLINGEAYPPYNEGLPCYVQLKNELAPKKL
jgi:ATP-dependent phosphofructokinase / diphosphate-dependent phosphofructokinase